MVGRLIAVVCVAGLGAGSAHAQYLQQQYGGGYGGFGGFGSGSGFGADPYSNPGAYAPNFYNRQTQPLSPYLNLLRGSNPATNYFYGVRPGTVGGGGGGPGGFANMAFGGYRPPFFQQQNFPDPLLEPDQQGSTLPPAGHLAVFNNYLGYFPSPYNNGRGMRPGLLGSGNQNQGRPAPKK